MYMEQMKVESVTPEAVACDDKSGALPSTGCGSLAFPYVPMQNANAKRYGNAEALTQGTLYPGLDLPFSKTGKTGKLSNSVRNDLMAIDFAIDELGLYLTTHSEDKDALALYWSYIRTAKEMRKKYESANGPLYQTEITEGGYQWLNDPWPWDEGGNR